MNNSFKGEGEGRHPILRDDTPMIELLRKRTFFPEKEGKEKT